MILRNALWRDVPPNMGWHTPYFAFSTLEFRYCLFLAEHTRYRLLLHCISHCLLWLVSNLSSWFVDGAGLRCLAVKTLSGVAVFVVAHSDPCKPVHYRYLRSKVCIYQSSVKLARGTFSVSLSIPLSLWAKMYCLTMNARQTRF